MCVRFDVVREACRGKGVCMQAGKTAQHALQQHQKHDGLPRRSATRIGAPAARRRHKARRSVGFRLDTVPAARNGRRREMAEPGETAEELGKRVAEIYREMSYPGASKLQSALRKRGIKFLTLPCESLWQSKEAGNSLLRRLASQAGSQHVMSTSVGQQISWISKARLPKVAKRTS